MSGVDLSEAHVRHYVAQVRQKAPRARVIGIRTRNEWSGPATLQVRGEELPIIVGRSPLQVREALLGINDEGPAAILLTNLPESELGGDVTARLARHRLYSIDTWQVVRDLFQANSIDPRLGADTGLAEALLDVLPQAGPPPVPAGVLDYQTAWMSLLQHGLGFTDEAADLRALLEWASDEAATERYRGAPDAVQTGAREFLEDVAGPAATLILGCIEAGNADRLVAIGLACRCVFRPDGDSKAAVRLEQYVGQKHIDARAALAWADEAEGLVQRRATAGDTAGAGKLRARADEFLATNLDAPHRARSSRFLPSSFKQRITDVGTALDQARTAPSDQTEALERAVSMANEHVDTEPRDELKAILEMLPRLVRWLKRPSTTKPTPSLGALAQDYLDDGCFADWARNATWGGSAGEGLAHALAALGEDVRARREAENRAFATCLADWSISPNTKDVLPIERVLDDVVAPLADARPVLVLVFDGMGLPVFQELLCDIESHGWIELAPEKEHRPLGPVIGTVPSVTEFSRASLLAGKLCRGDQGFEKKAFEAHPGLCAKAGSAHPPRLFHKGNLRDPSGVLADEVRDALQNPKQKIVGVVLNAVDDHLDSGGQIHIRWTCGRITPLLEILDAAADGGRAVVVVADHGHVVERDSKKQEGKDGERWRSGADARDGEIVIAGRRVTGTVGASQVVVPWSEGVRYGPKKNGYHGGVTPQEILVPLAVLSTPQHELPGWTDLPPRLPGWWAAPEPPVEEVVAEPTAKVVRPAKRPTAKDKRQTQLFDEPPAPSTATAAPTAWVASLLANDLFEEQRKRASRQPISDERIQAILHALHRRGGTMTGAGLAHEIQVSTLRLRGTLTTLRRLLNIEGYAVLSVDDATDTIKLDRVLLFSQFGIEGK